MGTVTASGTYDGQPVIFLGNESYLLSSVMAVGRLPQSVTPDSLPDTNNTTDDSDLPPAENQNTVDNGDMDDAGNTSGSEEALDV